jgi:TonB family protein
LTIPNTSIERLLPLSSTPLLYLIPVSYVSGRVQIARYGRGGGSSIKKLALSRQKYSVGGDIPIRKTNLRQGLTIPLRTLLSRSKRQKRKGLERGSQEEGAGEGWNIFGLRGFGRLGVSRPRYIAYLKPHYPLQARQQGCQGDVLLGVEAFANDRMIRILVAKSSGYEVFDQSAVSGVRKWIFIPARRGKLAILSWVNIPITFQLQDSNF